MFEMNPVLPDATAADASVRPSSRGLGGQCGSKHSPSKTRFMRAYRSEHADDMHYPKIVQSRPEIRGPW